MAALRKERWGGCARVPRVSHVIRQTSSLVPSSRGVCHTLGTGTTIGQGCMDDWSGMDSSPPLWLTQSQWGNKWGHALLHLVEQLFELAAWLTTATYAFYWPEEGTCFTYKWCAVPILGWYNIVISVWLVDNSYACCWPETIPVQYIHWVYLKILFNSPCTGYFTPAPSLPPGPSPSPGAAPCGQCAGVCSLSRLPRHLQTVRKYPRETSPGW